MKIWLLGGPFHGRTETLPDERASTWEVGPTSWPADKPRPKIVYVRSGKPEDYELPADVVPFMWDQWLAEDRAARRR